MKKLRENNKKPFKGIGEHEVSGRNRNGELLLSFENNLVIEVMFIPHIVS